MCNFEQSSISAGLLKDTTYQEKGKSIFMLSFLNLPFFSRTQKWITWRSFSNLQQYTALPTLLILHRNSQNAFDGKWTRTSGTCLHELCLIAEWRWVVYVDLRCMKAVLSYNVTFNCYDTFVVILGEYSDTVIYGWVKKQRWWHNAM